MSTKKINTPFVKVDTQKDDNIPPAERVNTVINNKNKLALLQLQLTEGRISSLNNEKIETFVPYPSVIPSHSGRTIFIPKTVTQGVVPPASYNKGWGTGPMCSGPHCGTSLTPTMEGMRKGMNVSDVSELASRQFPIGRMVGNSTDSVENYRMYTGTTTNSGPYRIKVSD
jgi:hypothetical protein